MIDVLVFVAVMNSAQRMVGEDKTYAIVWHANRVERKYGLPRGLLSAVILAESGGRKIIMQRKTGCDVGEGQVHVRACERERMKRLLKLSVNLEESAKILKRSERICTLNPLWSVCKLSKYALYNAGSRQWWKRVRSIWEKFDVRKT